MARNKKRGHGLDAIVELEIRDKDGKLLTKRRYKGGSFVTNFLRVLRRLMLRATALTTAIYYVKTGTPAEAVNHVNTAVEIWGVAGATTYGNNICVQAIGGEVDYGIRIGTSTDAPVPTDYNLHTPIGHGSGSGQMVYGDMTVDIIDIDGAISTLRLIRVFSNQSGAAITVNEIGLSAGCPISASARDYFLLARDLVTPPVSVPDMSTLTVRYILRVTT